MRLKASPALKGLTLRHPNYLIGIFTRDSQLQVGENYSDFAK